MFIIIIIIIIIMANSIWVVGILGIADEFLEASIMSYISLYAKCSKLHRVVINCEGSFETWLR